MGRIKLLVFRKQKGLKQYQMAERLGISRQYYNRLEAGLFAPSSGLLKKFSKEFPDVENVWDLFKEI